MNTQKIIDIIEDFAPKKLACSWDNTGWQINFANQAATKVILCLTCTENVVNQAVSEKCNLIISHHPLIFDKISCISSENTTSKVIIKAIQNNIRIYSAHTNLDAAELGISHQLASKLSLQNVRIPNISSEEANLIRVGEFSHPKSINETVSLVKESLKLDYINLINNIEIQEIKRVCVIAGSGAGFIPLLKDIDLLITGDVKYHQAIDAHYFAVIDAGHHYTEIIILETLKNLLSSHKIDAIIAKENPPWEVL